MTSTVTRDDVERRLRSAFTTKADQVVVRAVAPDLGASDAMPTLVEADPGPTGPPRTRRRVAIAVAVLVVLVLAIGGIARSGVLDEASGPDQVRTRPSEPIEQGEPSAPLLAPASIPSGLELWSLSTAAQGGGTAFTSGQLFGALDASGALAPGILIETQPASPGSVIRPGGPADATVRGHVVTVDQAKDGGEDTREFAWIEGDAEVRVTVRNATIDRAVEILDALQPRHASMQDGFDPASAPAGITELAADPRGSTATPLTSFAYGRDAPVAGTEAELVVWTTAGPAYPGYVRTWMAGARASDGVAVQFDPGVGVIVAWPDGRQAVASSSTLDPATLERVARSVTLQPADAADRLVEDLSNRVDGLPVLESATLPSGELELRGSGSLTAICLRTANVKPTCAGPGYRQYQTSTGGGIVGEAHVDGRWLVFVAANTAPTVTDTRLPTNGMPVPPLDVERATRNDWELALVVVPDGVDAVAVETGSDILGTLRRTG